MMIDSSEHRTPHSELDLLKSRHDLLKAIREFFYAVGYLEVETPNLMKTAAPDPNIETLKVYIEDAGPFFLHTSPEMGMKKLLLHGQKRIFQICKVYRVEESGEIHNTEFTMLEWYREGTYLDAMEEVENLVRSIVGRFQVADPHKLAMPWKTYDLSQLFVGNTGINPFALQQDELFVAMQKAGFLGIDEKDTWNDLFFKLFIQEVEPRIPKEAPYFIKDWPLSVSTMAQRKDRNRVERFELYIAGLEIANGYSELLDVSEQRQRFARDNSERIASGKQTYSIDEEFLDVLGKLTGPYTGVSVGVDRFLMALLGKDRIEEVLVQRFRDA
jgi:elongation factor P--(R)-beta-lysine ligase